MALAVADRVKESTTTTGTGTVNLAGAETGFQTFVAGIGNSNTTYYAIVDGNTGDFEVGIGTVTDASPDTLSRDTILQSSNSDSAVNFGSGTKSVFCTQPADKAVFKNADGNVNLPDNAEFQVGDRATTGDLRIRHNGTQSQIQGYTGQLQITNFANDNDVRILSDDSSGGVTDYFRADGSNGEAVLYHYGTEKFATKSTGVDVVGNITVSGTVDGRDLATDGTKLDGIEASADVTDATNVTAAGALMDSEVTNLAQVKAFDSSDYATAAQGTTADNALPKAGGTMTGNLSLSGTNTRINMPDNHVINRRFELDAVDASGVGYVLLCRNAASNDVNGRITMDRTSGLRHACQVDIIVSSGSSTNPIGSLKAHGVTVNAGSSPNGPSYELVTVTYDSDSNSYVALKITNPDNYYETSGAFFTGRLVNSGSNTLLAVLPSGISSEAQLTDANAKHTFQGDLDILDNIVIAGTVDGRDIATDGTKLDGIEASATADQTASEIRTLVESASDSNVFTDADHTKLNGIASSATANPNALDNISEDTTPQLGGNLDVNGNQIQLDQTSGVAIKTVGDLSTADLTLLQASHNNSGQYGFNINYMGSRTGNANSFALEMHNQNGTNVEAITVYQDGKVGINNTVPTAPLDVTGNIVVSGTVDGRDLATDGTKLDGVASSATANPNAIDNVVEDTTPQLGGDLDLNSNDITGTGNINITGTLQTSSNAIIGGDLTVSGTTTTVNTETINLADNNIVLNSNLSSSTAPSENGGITINRGSSTDKVFQWNESTDYWEADAILEIETDTGYVRIGSQTSTYTHFYTDRGKYYFNKELVVDEGIINSYNEDLQLGRAFSTTARMRLTDGTTHSDQAFDVTGNITVSGTVDGRDVATDGTKLDGIEASADVTDATNVAAAGALMDSEVTNLAQVKAFDSSDYATAAQGTTADAALPKAGGTMTGDLVLGDDVKAKFGASNDLNIFHTAGGSSSINNNSGTLQLNQFANDSDVVINSDDGSGSTANYFRADGSTGEVKLYHYGTEKLKTQSGGVDVTGNITVSGTVDGRDLATDGTKLDGIEASADVTDTANVTSAGALMDSEVTNLAQVKAFDSSDYATAAQGTTADAALPKAGGTMTGNISRGDNVKSIYGASDDLEIYHTGTNSIINDVGQGNLVLSTNGTSVRIAHTTNSEAMAVFTKNGSALLKHDGSDKLETSSSGVDVTGDIAVTGSMVFEGATADAHETTLAVTDPTADRTITLPNATGTVILNTNLNFPFFKADGSSDTIALTADNKLPFTKSDGSASNIALTT